MQKKQRFLQNPQGTESIHLEEALRHRQTVSIINELFSSWGYLPVETPIFDFFDIYQNIINTRENDIYRLIDREGDLLMLRSDITLFLAKQMGIILDKKDLPIRVFYSGSILRHQNREDISKNEFFQTGVELIGETSLNSDLEILTLLLTTFKTLSLSPRIHIGSAAVVNTIFKNIEASSLAIIYESLGDRDFTRIESFLKDKVPKEKLSCILRLLSFIGTGNEFEDLVGEENCKFNTDELKSIQHLTSIFNTMEKLNMADSFKIDMSETGDQNYYSGMVFRGYLAGVDSAVASGGRYDNLLKQFGFSAPSVGFSILLRKVESTMNNIFPHREYTKVGETDFVKGFKKAEEIRRKGEIAVL